MKWFSLSFNQESDGSLDDLDDRNDTSIVQQSQPPSEQESCEKSRLRNKRLQTELDEQGLDHGPQLEDHEVQASVCKVLARLRGWSNKFKDVEPDNDDTISEDVFRIIAPGVYSDNLDKRTVTADGLSRRLFLQGWTAYNMCSSIFGQDLWLNESASQSYNDIERLFKDTLQTERISPRTFHSWRTITANLLAKTTAIEHDGTRRAHVEAKVEELLRSIRPLCLPDIAPARIELQEIFQEAIEVAKVLRQQRAVWILRFPNRVMPEGQPDTSLKFSVEYMEDRDGHEDEGDRYVGIIGGPMLIKRGTLEGYHYDREEVFEKAEVTTYKPYRWWMLD